MACPFSSRVNGPEQMLVNLANSCGVKSAETILALPILLSSPPPGMAEAAAWPAHHYNSAITAG